MARTIENKNRQHKSGKLTSRDAPAKDSSPGSRNCSADMLFCSTAHLSNTLRFCSFTTDTESDEMNNKNSRRTYLRGETRQTYSAKAYMPGAERERITQRTPCSTAGGKTAFSATNCRNLASPSGLVATRITASHSYSENSESWNKGGCNKLLSIQNLTDEEQTEIA